MNTFNILKKELDSLPNNEDRKKYIQSVIENPLIGRHNLLRIACNIFHNENFIDSYYRVSFTDSLKINIKKTYDLFIKFVKKRHLKF